MSSEITQKDIEDTRSRIFFIVGTSRSGSTLLQSMLSSHNQMVIPPETHYFYSAPAVRIQYERAADKETFGRKLIDFWYDHKTRIRDLGLSKDEVLETAGRLGLSHPDDLFTLQLTMYRKERGKQIIGEKTPRHILHVQHILQTYPGAGIISMFRDPRAAAYSEIKAAFGSPSVMVTTRRWRTYVQEHEHLQKSLPDDQYMMLRYADLIDEVKDMLQQICAFLGVNFEDTMLEYYEREEEGFADGEKSWKKGTLKPIQENKNEEWKTGLTNWQKALVDDLAGDYLNAMGYEYSGFHLNFPKKWLYQCLDFGRSIRATLSGERKEGYADPHSIKF